MRLSLDTSAYSNFKKNRPECVQLLKKAESIAVPAITLGELFSGFKCGKHLDQNTKELNEFLAHRSVSVIEVNTLAADIYGQLLTALRRKGTPVPTNDIWIAATTKAHGYTVVTYDQHFSMMDGVAYHVL